ncbi:MAG: DUF423 domain-containing protein [Proteobacteria bacterium]|nr:DUF423 domain-containing protein [Pseudomonadota bacterium]
MEKTFFLTACIFAFLAVAAGAFAAHGLKTKISPEMLAIFETAARYQIYHAFALFIAAWATKYDNNLISYAGYLFIIGIIIFSGSLYLLSLTEMRWLGAITPLGGVAFLSGWLMLMLGCWRS